jgi:thioredoxin 1
MGAAWSAGLLPFPSRTANNKPIVDETRARLDVFLSILSAQISKSGASLDVQLPFGALTRFDTVNQTHTDWGFGDLELRGRYARSLFSFLRIQGALGLALPTGLYAAKSGIAAIVENAGYLTLGRGVTWAIGEVEMKYVAPKYFAAALGVSGRLALGNTADGFHWGEEVRPYLQLSAGRFFERLSFSAQLELQLRAKSTEIDVFTEERTPSVSTGGLWLTAVPAVQVSLTKNFTAFASVRIPLIQRLDGLQYVAGMGGFVGLAGSYEFVAQAQPRAPQLGQVTLIDYGATWCPPCEKLWPLIEAATHKYSWLTVQKIDATHFTEEQLNALPGGEGLPVVEVYGRDGKLIARLVGPEVFQFERIILENQP